MRSKVIFATVIPAIRLLTGNNNILFKLEAEDLPSLDRVEFYPSSLDGTVISLQTALGTEIRAEVVSNEYLKFEEYAMMVDTLPVMGLIDDQPIFRIASTVRVGSVTIELKDHDRHEHLEHLALK
jgi:hypothetical protein